MARVLRLLVYIAMLMVIPPGLFLLPPASVHYRIVERYRFSTGQPEARVYLAVMLPRSGPYQTIEGLTVDWQGEVRQRSYGAVDVVWMEGTTGDDGGLEAVLAYDVVLPQGRVEWDAGVADASLLLQANVESDAPALVEEAARLCGGEVNEDARRIYTFTAHYLSWPSGTRMGGEQSALAAYESGVGVCGEFALLMTALCRACSVPAVSIDGLSLPMFLPPM